jgi:hypothetical protein
MIASVEDLTRLGRVAYGGDSPQPPGVAALPGGELDRYAAAALEAGNHPEIPSEAWSKLEGQFLGELLDLAQAAGPWAIVGAMFVAANFVQTTDAADGRYLEIVDKASDILRRDGVAYSAVPAFALSRWIQVHGRDGARPAGWPSALTYVEAPEVGLEPPVHELADGESRRLARRELVGTKSYFAERRPDGTIATVIEGVDPETGDNRRWDWEGVSADTYVAFLRELGDRLVTPTEWAHEDLGPYFPCRPRSREEMRQLAA